MTQPSLLVRFAGSALGAFLLWAACLYTVIGCYAGWYSKWWAIGAVWVSRMVFSAIGTMRDYKRWNAEWAAMGAAMGAAPETHYGRQAARACVAALLVWGIPPYLTGRVSLWFLPAPPALFSNGAFALQGVRALAILYLAFVGARALYLVARSVLRRREEKQAVAEESAPVACVVELPSSSPSRAEARAALPEYAAKVMGGPGSVERQS